VESSQSLSGSSSPGYNGSDSGNLSLGRVRQGSPTKFDEKRFSSVLGVSGHARDESQTGRGTTMSGVEVGGPGSVSPVQTPTPVHWEGFDRFSTDDAAFIEPPSPLPSMSTNQNSVKSRNKTPSKLPHDFTAHPSPLLPVRPKFAGLSNLDNVPLKERARPESEFFSKGYEPNIRRE